MEYVIDDRPLSLLLLDDHEAARRALAGRLASLSHVRLVGHTAGVAAAVELTREHRPHAVLVDPRRQDGAGMEAIASLANAAAGGFPLVVVHASFYNAEEWLRARHAGACDWLLKQLDVDRLILKLRAIIEREAGD